MKIIILRFPYVKSPFCTIICDLAQKLEYDIEGIVSFDLEEKLTSYEGYPIYPLIDINKLSWDIAVYACDKKDFNDILPRMIELGIGKKEQFKNSFWLLKQLMIKKYEDFNDPVIQDTIEYWKTHEVSVFNQHINTEKSTLYRIFIDDNCNLPYIFFETVGGDNRRMYFPANNKFFIHNDEKFIANILREQEPTSPHLYIKDEHKVNAGDIVIDAGVCEGNFALKYVDICSKMYLFEPDPIWQEPLYQTFKDYRDKVEIIPKFLSDKTQGNTVTIDDRIRAACFARREKNSYQQQS